jgi:cytochrome c oxidase subunit 4
MAPPADAGAGAPAPHPPGPAHAGTRTYLVVAAFLVVLTAMEVLVFYVAALAQALVPILVVLAVAKFALVAMFYMHLRFDARLFTHVFAFSLTIAVGLGLSLLWLFHQFGRTE